MSGLPPSSAHGASRVRPFLFKTRLCPAFMATAGSATPTFHGNASPLPTQHQHQDNSSSGCRFGAACSFAHGPDELRTTKQNIAERVTSENGLHAYRRRARAAARGGVRNAPIPAPPEDVAGSLPNSPREDVPCLARAGDGPSSSAEESRRAQTSSLKEPLSRVSIEEKPLPTVKETSVAADVADARQPHPVSPLVNEPAASTCSAASSASLGSPAPPQHPRRSSALLAVQTAPSIGAHGDRYPFQHDPYRPIKRSPPAAGSGYVTPVMASRAEHVGSSSTPT